MIAEDALVVELSGGGAVVEARGSDKLVDVAIVLLLSGKSEEAAVDAVPGTVGMVIVTPTDAHVEMASCPALAISSAVQTCSRAGTREGRKPVFVQMHLKSVKSQPVAKRAVVVGFTAQGGSWDRSWAVARVAAASQKVSFQDCILQMVLKINPKAKECIDLYRTLLL